MTAAINAISALGANSLATTSLPKPQVAAAPTPSPLGGFGKMISEGLAQVNDKVATADKLVRSFALDGSSVPLHQVTIAVEDARLAVEMAMQVRTRLVDAYREIMNTQL